MKLDRFFFYLSSVAYGRVSEFVAGERKTTKLQKNISLTFFFIIIFGNIETHIVQCETIIFLWIGKDFFLLLFYDFKYATQWKNADERKTKKKCLKCTSGNRHWAVEIATDFTLIKRDRQQLIMIEVYLNVKIILISLSWMIVYNLFFSSSHHHHRIIR